MPSPTALTTSARTRLISDYQLHVVVALVVVAAYGWDAWLGINLYLLHAVDSLTAIAWDVAVIALCILLVRGRVVAQLLLAVAALAGLKGRWAILTSLWFWMPHMEGRRTLLLMTTAANVLTLVLLAVPLVWRYSTKLLRMAAPRQA
jgi:hypothetical protein